MADIVAMATLEPISPVLRSNIMILAKAFAKARGIKLSTVSRLIRGDMFFMDQLIKREIGVTSWKYDEILKYFDDHWPDNVPMPKIIEFPKT